MSSSRHDTGGRLEPHAKALIERVVSRVLGIGIGVAVALMVLGLILGVVEGEGLPSHVVSLADVPSQLSAFNSAAFLSLGVLVLIATPFVRVAGSIVAFACERDRRYVLVTAVVLFVMCLSVALGRA